MRIASYRAGSTANRIAHSQDIFALISYDEFIIAQAIVDDVQGTNQVKRPVERDVCDKWFGYENRQARLTDINSGAITEIEIDGIARFWIHVMDIASWLEPDGSFYHAGKRQYFSKPKRIALELTDMGFCFVTREMVEEAQNLKT